MAQKEVSCMNCGETMTEYPVFTDKLGRFTVCSYCDGSFDIVDEEEEAE